MAKFYSTITRDIIRELRMGPLVVAPLGVTGFGEREIAPAHVHRLPMKSGTVGVFPTKAKRDAFVAAINADHPGAAIAS